MTNDYRALCAELVDALENARRIIEGADGTLHINTAEFVLRRARALLAQPVAEGLTDEQIMELMPQQMRDDLAAAARAMAGFDRANVKAAGAIRIILNRHAVDHARAVLDKWGRQ